MKIKLEKLKKELDPNGENLKIIEEYERLQKENPGFLNLYEYEKDQKKTINTLQSMAREEGHEEGYNSGISDGEKQKSIEIAKYNVPIGVDTLKRREPINCTQVEGIKSLKVDTNLWVL